MWSEGLRTTRQTVHTCEGEGALSLCFPTLCPEASIPNVWHPSQQWVIQGKSAHYRLREVHKYTHIGTLSWCWLSVTLLLPCPTSLFLCSHGAYHNLDLQAKYIHMCLSSEFSPSISNPFWSNEVWLSLLQGASHQE